MGMASRKMSHNVMNSTKLIVVLGSTATGKSKLGIELAKAFGGEVISADSMQVYKGLDIITNKVTKEESEGIPHHLIDVVSPKKEFTVVDFKKQALEVVQDLSTRGKVPIIVGGTNYFIESLLWDYLIDDESNESDSREELQNRKRFKHDIRNNKTEKETNMKPISDTIVEPEGSSLYDQLSEVDPDRASQLHPNDVRKLSRSLQIFHSTGKTHSQLMAEQQGQDGSSNLSGPLRFPNSLVFWLTAEQRTLDERIATRVDSMVDKGLLSEIKMFYENHIVTSEDLEDTASEQSGQSMNKTNNKNCSEGHKDSITDETTQDERHIKETLCKSYEEGLFQAIGFKEFHPYLTYTGTDEVEKKKLLSQSLEHLKQITIRYSKKQKRWVQNRFLARPKENAPALYNLDATNLEEWNANVLQKAKEITTDFLNGSTISYEPLPLTNPSSAVDKHAKHVCEVCNGRIIIGDDAWQSHLQSRKHKKMKASKNSKESKHHA